MELPPPDPVKMLRSWMEWERGEATPGRAMADLKTAGLRQLLESFAAEAGTGQAWTGQVGTGQVGTGKNSPGQDGPGKDGSPNEPSP
ncbi:MAG: hypothetical protein ACYCXN_00340 [Acidimicrobiales bacterium]|jgi:hypothetical protein